MNCIVIIPVLADGSVNIDMTHSLVQTMGKTHTDRHPHKLTQRHDREVFAPEFAGKHDLLSKSPASV